MNEYKYREHIEPRNFGVRIQNTRHLNYSNGLVIKGKYRIHLIMKEGDKESQAIKFKRILSIYIDCILV